MTHPCIGAWKRFCTQTFLAMYTCRCCVCSNNLVRWHNAVRFSFVDSRFPLFSSLAVWKPKSVRTRLAALWWLLALASCPGSSRSLVPRLNFSFLSRVEREIEPGDEAMLALLINACSWTWTMWAEICLDQMTVCMVCDSLVELTWEPGLLYEQFLTAYSIHKRKAWNIYLTSVST